MKLKMEEVTKKKNTGLIVTIIILILIIIGMGVYIAYDKGVIFKTSADVEEKKGKVEKKVEEEKTSTEENVKPLIFDSDKCINNNEMDFEITNSRFDVNVSLNSDKKSVTFSGDWGMFGENESSFEHNINNFSKEISDVLIGIFGWDGYSSSIIYLMEDGTVEYTPIRKAKEANDFKSYGKINGVEDIVSIKQILGKQKNSPVGGGYSVAAQKKDGTFYDLSNLIKE